MVGGRAPDARAGLHVSRRRFDQEPGYVLHTYPYKESSLIVEAFSLQDTRVHMLERGLEYPHDVQASIPLNRRERREVTPVGV